MGKQGNHTGTIIQLLILLAISVFVAGCGPSTANSGSTTGYLGGTQGLEMEFMAGSPPDYIFDSGSNFDFDVQVKLENMGEIDIPSGGYNVDLVGIDLALFGLNPAQQPTGELAGRYLDPEGNVIPGGITYWTWSSNGYTGTVTGNTPYTMYAEACYRYGSEAQAFLCYKADDMMDTDSQSVCRVRENKQVQNAGSPIQVTRLSESPMGSDKISFTFEISHSGSGQLFLPDGNSPTCTDDLQHENGVKVTVEPSNQNSDMSCSFPSGDGLTGTVQLYNGRFTLRCTETVPEGAKWESLVTIKTEFDYKQKISKQLIVKPSS